MQDPYRLKFHLMPPEGWMNDPNGLCEFRGEYHVFFQYTPESAEGNGKRCWGHYKGKSLIDLTFCGIVLMPDTESDRDGAFSGSALVDADKLKLYYTGNVEWAGDYDHTYAGREANTILVESADGVHFSAKQKILGNDDYPDVYTCHVRDPKVWKTDSAAAVTGCMLKETLQDGSDTYMVQGGRLDGRSTQDGDKGAVLVFKKSGNDSWRVINNITTEKPFGYMWECPDYMELEGKRFLSCCPQGLLSENYRYQNVHQSGYFILPQDFEILKQNTDDFVLIHDPQDCFYEWDMGFDFYAPQSFTDERGRRILIGWAGIGDAEYDNEPTVKRGWQHALTVPRELHYSEKEGKLLQWPVSEIDTLRKGHKVFEQGEGSGIRECRIARAADILVKDLSAGSLLKTEDEAEIIQLLDAAGLLFGLRIARKKEAYVITLHLSGNAGRGRKERRVLIDDVNSIRVLLDTSLAEIYINGGAYVMTTRYYASADGHSEQYCLRLGACAAEIWDMDSFHSGT